MVYEQFFYFYFLLPMHGGEIVVLEGNFWHGNLDGLTLLRFPESENHIFKGCSVYVCVCALSAQLKNKL